MRVRQDGDSRGVGEPPRLSVQVLCLAPAGCSRFLPIHVYVLSLKEKIIISALSSGPRKGSVRRRVAFQLRGGGRAERAGGFLSIPSCKRILWLS